MRPTLMVVPARHGIRYLAVMGPYFRITRSHTYSLLLAFPLLLLYEAGAIWLSTEGGASLRNGADVLLRSLLAIVGVEGTAALAWAVAIAAVIVIIRERRGREVRVRPGLFLLMLMESALYAVLLGIIVGTATQRVINALAITGAQGAIAQMPLRDAVILSLGAGLYEELLFRVLLVGGIFAVMKGSGASSFQAGLSAVILASLIFSGFHYIGPYGDPWELPSFLFRFLAGMAFSLLFLIRGFGITAWTHALYDIFLVVALTL